MHVYLDGIPSKTCFTSFSLTIWLTNYKVAYSSPVHVAIVYYHLSLYPSNCRRLFNWFLYMLFFYNALIGIVTALVRVAIAAGIGMLLLFRLDKVILMKGFEFADFGESVPIP